jgi:hypothetical protein
MILSGQILLGEKVLFSSSTNYETRQPASTVPVYAFEGLITPEFDSASADLAISLLRELARAQEFEEPRTQEARAYQRPNEYTCPLEKVPPGEWRSLGGYFDYTHWADRERFMELDRAIAASHRRQTYELEIDSRMF